MRPAHADRHCRRRVHGRAAAALAILCAAATSSTLVGAQTSRPCVAVDAERDARVGALNPPLDSVVSFRVHGVSLRDALDRLGASSGVPLAYSSDLLPLDRPVCVIAERQPLGLVLATLLAGTNVEAQVVAHNVVLAPAAPARETRPSKVSVLDRVIVTGSPVATSRRHAVVGIEVIDGGELRLGGVGELSSALDAYVPGVWLWDQAPGSVVAQYGGVRGASSFGSSRPKMYIDGVEVANPLLVTQLDPDVVDRVEVIRGPQGSALYGSDAISGVINVVTRHDGASTNHASVQVSSLAGASASRFGTSLVPTHDQRVSLRTGSNLSSAGLALEFGQTGAVFPSAQSRQTTLVGDARKVTSSTTLSGSARLFDRRAGIGDNPLLAYAGSASPAEYEAGERYAVPVLSDGDQHVRLYTIGGSATIATHGVWTHTLLAGLDGYRLDGVADPTELFDAGADPARRVGASGADRTTMRASSVAQIGGAGDIFATTLTVSLEQSVFRQRFSASPAGSASPGGRYPTLVGDIARATSHNTGMLAQVSSAWRDALFVTGGLRLERNDAFSGDDRYPVLPLFGVAFVRSIGPVEMKVRSSYGKGIRPPAAPVRGASDRPTPMELSPGLDPEVQTGIESGVELYAGNVSLQATRFDQRATGLIQSVAVAVDSQLRGSSLQHRMRFQLENVGEITNRGWEMQAAVRRGALGVKGTLTTVDSRVRAVARGYLGDLRAGDRMLAVPARTASLAASWAGTGWSAALTATRAVDWVNYDRVALVRAYTSSDGAEQRAVMGSRMRNFWRGYDGDTHLRLSASRDVGLGLELLVVGDNLLGGQLGEPDNLTIRQGRTVTGGLRASF